MRGCSEADTGQSTDILPICLHSMSQSPRASTFIAFCEGHPAQVLIDSGCTTPYPLMSADFVTTYGFPLQQISPIQLSTVTKDFGPSITKACDLTLHYDVLINGQSNRIKQAMHFYIHPTGPYDIILPFGWLDSILKRNGSGMWMP